MGAMAKMPRITGTRFSPFCSASMPKVSRGCPSTGSSPTSAQRMPSRPAISALMNELPPTAQIMTSPNSTKANISNGPNLTPSRPSGSATNASTSHDTMAPKNCAPMAMPSARAARPLRAMG